MADRSSATLQVYMNGRLVGRLHNSSQKVVSFVYDESWLQFKYRRPISLSMPLGHRVYSGQVVENYFDNLLPDSQPIRSRLQAQTGAESAHCFDLLAHIGRDCIGALQLLPEGETVDVKTVSATPVSEEDIEAVLDNLDSIPLGIAPDVDFRLSIAGAQEKTAFLFHKGSWCRPQCATPTSHLFKIPIGELGQSGIDLSDSVENEWLCQMILRAFDLPIANCEIRQFGRCKALVVDRFDRMWSEDGSWLIRLSQEDMCQALGSSGTIKYESEGGPGMQAIMDILLGSVESYHDRTIFMKSQLLFWMLAAIDGHAKNFSILHLPGGRYKLAPLYDVISAYPIISSGQFAAQRVRMAMAVQGKNRHYRWDTISRRHWHHNARKCRFSKDEMEKLINKCCSRVEEVIEQVSDCLPQSFPEAVESSIFMGLRAARDRLMR
jgi:serine/threonine-protein kinase HipA